MSLPPEVLVFLLAMAPISELRGAIPAGVFGFKIPFLDVFLLSIVGNLIPVIFLLLFLEPLSKFLSKKSRFFEGVFNWLFKRTRKKIDKHIIKYEKIGLVIFVAIPFPLTGGWTGAIAAFLLGLPFKVAFPLISLGVLLAGIIVSVLTISGVVVQNIFGWPALVTIIVFLGIIYLLFKKFKKPKSDQSTK